MKIIICDDEKIYADDIEQKVEFCLRSNAMEAEFDIFTDCKALLANECDFYDMAFLDIEMGEIKGTQIATKLKEVNPKILIFVITSYDQYLDDAMDLNVFRYLKKPIQPQRLCDGLEKALSLLDNMSIEFYLKSQKQLVKVETDDIIFVEIQGHSTRVVTTKGEYISESNMSFWSEKLASTYFYRVHTSFIINIKYITKYTRKIVILDNRYEVPISYRTQATFRKYFIKYSGGK